MPWGVVKDRELRAEYKEIERADLAKGSSKGVSGDIRGGVMSWKQEKMVLSVSARKRLS